jgi:hypothetical protein
MKEVELDNVDEEFFYGTQEMAERTQLLEWVAGGGWRSWWAFCDADSHVERRVMAVVLCVGRLQDEVREFELSFCA